MVRTGPHWSALVRKLSVDQDIQYTVYNSQIIIITYDIQTGPHGPHLFL